MDIKVFLADKSLKPKQKTEHLGKLLLAEELSVDDLLAFAQTAKDPAKATCIEALELACQSNPNLVKENHFHFIISCTTAKAPRVKWESAKVIALIAGLYKDNLDAAIVALLNLTNDEGTVVRWSAATALSAIVALKTSHHETLLESLKQICETETQNSIKKIYLKAFKMAVL